MINAFLTGAGCVIGVLLSAIIYLAKGSIDRLNVTISGLIKKNEKSEADITKLDLRLSEQETICSV